VLNDNLIFISGGTDSNIKKALRQWMKAYSDELPDDLIFYFYKNGQGKHIIKADERLDNWLFYFLVNYLNYPEGIKHTFEVEGFTSGNNDDILKNEKLLVYILPDDECGDNVYITTSENKNYKVDFGGKITEASETKIYRLPATQHLENPEIVKINKELISKKHKEKSIKNTKKRFNVITLIILIAFILNIIVPKFLNILYLFEDTTFFIFFGVGFWFFWDTELLKSNSLFMKCVLIALGCLVYEYYLINYFQQSAFKPVSIFSFSPLIFLVVQWPTRRLFKFIFKCEPKTDFHGKFTNFMYSLLLLSGWLTLSFWLMTICK
jgi:hypothetical protein